MLYSIFLFIVLFTGADHLRESLNQSFCGSVKISVIREELLGLMGLWTAKIVLELVVMKHQEGLFLESVCMGGCV